MFGYVRARRDTISKQALEDYESVYCGLCHTMGRRHGWFSRLFLNYDFVFLAMLLAGPEESGTSRCLRCMVHPVHGKTVCEGREWLDTAADESVILTWWKLKDNLADGGIWTRAAARTLLFFLRSGYRRAREACPGFDQQVGLQLQALRELEEQVCPSLDRTGDCFARLLCGAVPVTGNSARDRVMEQLLYHVGRWIYLADAADDLSDDRKAGRYNPVAARFPDWTEEDRSSLRLTMDHSLSLAGAAFQLLEPNRWSPVVENILYSGLPGVEELIFSGQWRDYLKKHRRIDP